MSIKTFLRNSLNRFVPTLYQQLYFYRKRGYWPSISNPKTINEQLLKLKINSSNELSVYADKLAVKEIIDELIGKHAMDRLKMPDTLCESDSVSGFVNKFKPNDAFIKANHGSGMSFYFNKDDRFLSKEQLKEMQSWLETDYAKFDIEECYDTIPKRILAEAPLRLKDGSLPDDIKVHCYCGNPVVVQILRRTSGQLERQTFDAHWQPQSWFQNEVLNVDLSTIPQKEVIEYSRILSSAFKYVRADFYLVDGILYFSELTFFPAGGRLPLRDKKVDHLLGKKFLELCEKRSHYPHIT